MTEIVLPVVTFRTKKYRNCVLKSFFLLWYFVLKIVQLFWKKTQEFPTEIVFPVLVFCHENRNIFLKKNWNFTMKSFFLLKSHVLPVVVF